MEQGNCLDSTLVSAAQDVRGGSSDEPALDVAVTALLRRPSGPEDDLPPSLPGAYGTTTPALAALVEEWCRLENEMNSRETEDEELDPISARMSELQALICAFEAHSIADVQAKVPVRLHERSYEGVCPTQAPSMVAHAWDSVVRDIDALGGMRLTAGQASADPIFPMIEEGRRLLKVAEALYARPERETPKAEKEAEAERSEAHEDLGAQCDQIMTMIPTTAAGCRELARFAGEYFKWNELPISDDEQAIVRLIAASPLLDTPSPTYPAAGTTVLSPKIVTDTRDPAMVDAIASEGLALANAIVTYFGEGPILDGLTADIALRDRALRIRALGGHGDGNPDAELRAVGEAWPRLVAEAEQAIFRLDDATDAYDAPEVPHELRVFNYELAGGFPLPPQMGTAFAPYGLDQVTELRATPRMAVYYGGTPEGELLEGGGYRRVNEHAQKRAEAIIAAWDAWSAEVERREAALDIPALRLAAHAAIAARDTAALRVRTLKAHTFLGLKVKAEVAAVVIPWRDRDAQAAGRDADDETGHLYVLVSDVLRVLGGTDLKQAIAS